MNNIEVPGLRYEIDEHGNINYLQGYSGAPLIPRKSMGMNAIDFVTKYTQINKFMRPYYLYNIEIKMNNLQEEYKEILEILKNYEKYITIYDNHKLLVGIMCFYANKTIYKRRNNYYVQNKYFKEILEMLNDEKENVIYYYYLLYFIKNAFCEKLRWCSKSIKTSWKRYGVEKLGKNN
jgi:hypothetical protein